MPLTPRQLQTLLWTGVAALLVWAMLALGPVLAPFAAAAILAYVLEPTVRWGTRHRLPRALSVTATMVLALLLFLAVLLIVVPIVQKESVQLRVQLPALVATLTGKLVPWLRETLGVELDLNPGVAARLAGRQSERQRRGAGGHRLQLAEVGLQCRTAGAGPGVPGAGGGVLPAARLGRADRPRPRTGAATLGAPGERIPHRDRRGCSASICAARRW
jgi:hypothetical protein